MVVLAREVAGTVLEADDDDLFAGCVAGFDLGVVVGRADEDHAHLDLRGREDRGGDAQLRSPAG